MKLVHFLIIALMSIALSPSLISAEDDADEKVPVRVPIQDAVIQNAEDRDDDSSPNGDYAAPDVQPVYNAPGPDPVIITPVQPPVNQYGSPRFNIHDSSSSSGEGISGGNGPIIVPNPAPVFSGGYNNGPSFGFRQQFEPNPVPLPRPIASSYGSPTFNQPGFGFGSGSGVGVGVGFRGGYSNNYVAPSVGYGAPQFRHNVGFGSITSVNFRQHGHQGGYSGGGFNYRNHYQHRPGFSSVVGPSFGTGVSTGVVRGGYA